MPPAFATAPYAGAGYARILALMEQDADRYLNTVDARERDHGVTVETMKATGAPCEVIVHYGRTHPNSLLVLGTRGWSGWRAAALGSVARRVVLLAGGPVLLVRATAPAAN